MGFLESIQHGLEKASQEATRITKIQHLHNVVNDLTSKESQEGQTLIAQAMDMYHNGRLGQGELVVICQQIATYQQNITEVQAEIQRLQQHENNPEIPLPPPLVGYPAYPQDASAPTENITPTAPLVQPDNLVYPTPTSNEPTSQLDTVNQDTSENASEPPAKPKRHAAAHKASTPPPEAPAEAEPASTVAPGSYAQGVLPPVYSPFAAQAAPTAATESAEAEPPKPSRAHHTKKATTEPVAEPAEPVEESK